MNLEDFLVYDHIGNGKTTKDRVFIQSSYKLAQNYDPNTTLLTCPTVYATDYAKLNFAYNAPASSCGIGSEPSTMYYLRNYSGKYVELVEPGGDLAQGLPTLSSVSVCPVMRLDIDKIVQSGSLDLFKPYSFTTVQDEEVFCLNIGEFPKTYVGKNKNHELCKAMDNGRLTPTNKKYFGHTWDRNYLPLREKMNREGNMYEENKEYLYKGEKYVRVSAMVCNSDSRLSTGDMPENLMSYWCKVEPIQWRILNWDYFPKSINPDGANLSKHFYLRAEYGIIAGMPFYPFDDANNMYWQNSTIRAYLNGINVNNLDTSSPHYAGYPSAPNGGDFTGERSFLYQAFNIGAKNLSLGGNGASSAKSSRPKVRRKKQNVFGVKVANRQLNQTEQIKFYVEKGKSFMLHGPSGIGKTRRIEEADPNFVPIVLRNGMLPEEVIGKTIYPNGDTSQPSVWMAPAWYISLCEKCAREPNKNHVLFIDEITNVKPAEQSLVYNLVLTRSIGPNLGKLPSNVVVVAAGNSKTESEAAYNMPEPLFRRFEAHIRLKPNVEDWLVWGAEKSDKGENRLKIHPLVSSFVAAFEGAFYSDYDSEEPPEFAIDPRGWEQVSDLIYDNDGEIFPELIENKVGKEISQSFVAFAQKAIISLEDVLEDNYDYEDIPTKFDQQLVVALILKYAKEEDITKVYAFVKDNFCAEITSFFEKHWVGDSAERAILIDNLKNSQKKENASEEKREKVALTQIEEDASSQIEPVEEKIKRRIAGGLVQATLDL